MTSTETEEFESATTTETLTEDLQEIEFDISGEADDAPARSSLYPSPWLTGTEEDVTEDSEESTTTEDPNSTDETDTGVADQTETGDGSSPTESTGTVTQEVVEENVPALPEVREFDYEREAIKEFVSRFKKLPHPKSTQSFAMTVTIRTDTLLRMKSRRSLTTRSR